MQHLPLSQSALELLREMKARATEDHLFPGRKKGQHLENLKGDWKQLCRAAQLENFRVHDIRHTYASVLVSNGESLPIVGKLLGHTQWKTTERYAHLAEDSQRAATNRAAKLLSGKSA